MPVNTSHDLCYEYFYLLCIWLNKISFYVMSVCYLLYNLLVHINGVHVSMHRGLVYDLIGSVWLQAWGKTSEESMVRWT